ncbi:MAG: hydroxypyruvate isomerase family protein [Planctomycetota bacterium]
MDRREFMSVGLPGMGLVVAGAATALGAAGPHRASAGGKHQFKLKYAPHFGMFRNHGGDDLVDQLRFMADEGFTALEDNGMRSRSLEDQARVAKEMELLGMTMGVFVAYADFRSTDFVSGNKEKREGILQNIRDSVECAKRVNAQWVTVVPGAYDPRMEPDYQTANAIETLKYCAEICEPSGLIMVLEPLNPWRDHPGLFLTKIPQAYLICRAVNSPSCKILFDIYHQQITEGNLIPNMNKSWDEIAYFQIGDNPGRCEPTTGEINYKNVFKHIHDKGFKGIMGMEHGNSKRGKEGERAVIDAYAACDDF